MEAKINNINNTVEQRKLRKAQMTLVIVGTGIIMFGAWAALKVYSLILLRPEETIKEIRKMVIDESDPISDRDVLIWILVFATVYVLIELGVRVFVGRAAIAEGRGIRSGKIYIVFTIILILAALLAVLFDLIVMINDITGESVDGELTRADAGTSFVIDLTSLVMMIEMMVSAFRVKKHNRVARRTEAEHAA